MNGIINGSYIKEGKASLELTKNDLFDKIINLRFTRVHGRSFTVRSDYEPVHHKDGTTSFKRCVQKPDIKIEYKQVAESVAIEVDIRITNFFIGDGDKENPESMNTVTGDPVQWCTIQMGYRAQFPDWTKAKSKKDIEKFYALDDGREIKEYNTIQAQILTGYSESYPPDKVTYFKGIIGSMETGLRWKQTINELVRNYGNPEIPEKFSEVEAALFQLVTRRFIRPSIRHIAVTERDFTNKEAIDDITDKRFEQRVRIHRDECEGSELEAGISDDDEYVDMPLLENGLMSVENAKRFGVICAVSQCLRDLAENNILGHGATPEQAQAVQEEEFIPFNEMHNTIGGQLTALRKHYTFLRWYETVEGNYFFYHVDDTDMDLWADPYVQQLRKNNTLPLPAIYDMTLSGTRTIRCPFISFLSPMMTVQFQSRYVISSLTGYFFPLERKEGEKTKTTDKFLVIISNVSFATVQEDNLMELMCVDNPSEDTDDKEPPSNEQAEKKVTRMQQERNMKWTEEPYTVARFDSWDKITRNKVRANIKLARWPEGTEPTEKMELEALIEPNKDYFDPNGEYMSRGESLENFPSGIGGRTGIKVPLLYPGDIITVRYPFQPEYPPDQKEEAI